MAGKNRRSGLRGLDPGRRQGVGSVLVEPYLQIKLGLFLMVLNLVFAGVIGGLIYYYVMDMYQAMSFYFKLDEAENLMTWNKFSWPLIVCSVVVVTFIVATFIIIIRYTHKIYGPLVSINSFLDKALAGENPKPLQVRQSDYLGDLAEKINQLYAHTDPQKD